MSTVSIIAGLAVISLLASIGATLSVRRLLLYQGCLDVPGVRRMHTVPVPRGGGVAIALAIGCTWLLADGMFQIAVGSLVPAGTAIVVGSLLILAVGLVDDLRGLPPRTKLLFEILVAAGMFVVGVRVSTVIPLPLWLDAPVTVFWFLLVINSINLIDGLDGLATGVALLGAGALAAAACINGDVGQLLFLIPLVAALSGFLLFNRSPAKIFLGDSGSLYLGFLLSCASLQTPAFSNPINAGLFLLLVFAIPFSDTALAVWRRSAKMVVALVLRQPPAKGLMAADAEHMHHRLLEWGVSHRNVSHLLHLVTFVLCSVGIAGILQPKIAAPLYLVTLVVYVAVVLRCLAYIEFWNTGVAIIHGLGDPRKVVGRNLIRRAIDVVGIAAATVLGMWAAGGSMAVTTLHILSWVFVTLVVLSVGEVLHRRPKRERAVPIPLTTFGCLLMLVGTVSYSVLLVSAGSVVVFCATFLVVSLPVIAGARLGPYAVRSYMARRLASSSREETRPTLPEEARAALLGILQVAEEIIQQQRDMVETYRPGNTTLLKESEKQLAD